MILRLFFRLMVVLSVVMVLLVISPRVFYSLTQAAPTPVDVFLFPQCGEKPCWFGVDLDSNVRDAELALVRNGISYRKDYYSNTGVSLRIRDTRHEGDMHFTNNALTSIDIRVRLCIGDVLIAHGIPDLFSINPHGTFVAYYTQEQMRINGRGTRVSFARLTMINPEDLNSLEEQIYRPNSLLMFDRYFRRQCTWTSQLSG